MKEIYVAFVILFVFGLFLVGTAVIIINSHIQPATRMVAEQINYDDYTFIMPDGETLNTRDLQEINNAVIA